MPEVRRYRDAATGLFCKPNHPNAVPAKAYKSKVVGGRKKKTKRKLNTITNDEVILMWASLSKSEKNKFIRQAQKAGVDIHGSGFFDFVKGAWNKVIKPIGKPLVEKIVLPALQKRVEKKLGGGGLALAGRGIHLAGRGRR